MDHKRNLGVTEARFALTILTCLLVAIGYITLLRLVGPKDIAGDTGPDDVMPPSIAGPSLPPADVEIQPRVVPIEKPDDRNEPSSLAIRPQATTRTTGQPPTEPELR